MPEVRRLYRVGGSLVISLPRRLLRELRWYRGEYVAIQRYSDGGLILRRAEVRDASGADLPDPRRR